MIDHALHRLLLDNLTTATLLLNDELRLEYVVYVRTAPGIYARKMTFHTGIAMVNAMWFVQTDMAEMAHSLCKVTAEAVDESMGGLTD